jgi:hypothetical protein
MLTLSPGDHIRVWRGSYYHHGIFVGHNVVVHFTDVRNSKAAASIRQCTVSEFASGGRIERVRYSRCLPAGDVVGRALGGLGRNGYNVFSNNCEHFARWCKTGQHASEQVQRAHASVGGASATWGTAVLGLQALPVLAAPTLSGAAQTMSGLRAAGAVVGGGAAAGVVLLAAAPAALAATATHAIYADDPHLAEDERAARKAARRAGTIGAVAGSALSLAGLGSSGSPSASALTGALKLLRGGRMAGGLAALIGFPAVAAGLSAVAVYRIVKQKNQALMGPALPRRH